MLTKIRWKVANHYIKKARRSIAKGGYKNIKIGMKYFRRSLAVVPEITVRNDVCTQLRHMAEKYQQKYKDQA